MECYNFKNLLQTNFRSIQNVTNWLFFMTLGETLKIPATIKEFLLNKESESVTTISEEPNEWPYK